MSHSDLGRLIVGVGAFLYWRSEATHSFAARPRQNPLLARRQWLRRRNTI